MPLKIFEPVITIALNNSNDTSDSGMTDVRTGQALEYGGMMLGDCFDLTDDEAAALSYTAGGLPLLRGGRYRRVQVDSAATTANIGAGRAASVCPTSYVLNVVFATLGSGMTPGSYQVAANPGSGGGSGAVIVVTVGSNGQGSGVYVQSQGSNYLTPPTFTMPAAAGGTACTFASQLEENTWSVTSYDKNIQPGQVRGIFLNAPTPGNYTFIQEKGVAWVQSTSAGFTGTAAKGNQLQPYATANDGTWDVITQKTPALAASALDIPVSGQLSQALLQLQDWPV